MKFVGIKFWGPVKDSDTGSPSSITVSMEYLLAFQYWYCVISCDICVKNRWGEHGKHCFSNFCSLVVLDSSVDEGWCGVGQKSCLWPAEIASFSSRDFSRSNNHVTFWYVVSVGYFYVLVDSHADNIFYKYIYLFQILYNLKSVFLLKYMFWTKLFHIQIWCKCETPHLN